MKIGIVNASSRLDPARAEAVQGWFATHFPDGSISVVFHPASFGKHGHFGFPHVAHGPMASDSVRHDETAWRAVNWLVHGDPVSLEPSLAGDPRPAVAFNLSILDALVGTYLEPDLTGHVLMLEDVSEPLYRIDRMMFHLTAQPSIRRVASRPSSRMIPSSA